MARAKRHYIPGADLEYHPPCKLPMGEMEEGSVELCQVQMEDGRWKQLPYAPCPMPSAAFRSRALRLAKKEVKDRLGARANGRSIIKDGDRCQLREKQGAYRAAR